MLTFLVLLLFAFQYEITSGVLNFNISGLLLGKGSGPNHWLLLFLKEPVQREPNPK